MKKIFSFLTALVLAICAFAFTAEANPSRAANPPNSMQILLIGDGGGIGSAALAQFITAHPETAIVVVQTDYDGTGLQMPSEPLIASKFGAIPMATVEQIHRLTEPDKTDPPAAVSELISEAYAMPPNITGYDGQRVSNLIRADTNFS